MLHVEIKEKVYEEISVFEVYFLRKSILKISYTGWLVTGGTSAKGMILREKRSRKYRIKIFRLRLSFRENRL